MVIVVDKDICLFRKRPKEFFFILLEESLEKWRQGWENMSPPIQTDLDYSSWLTAASLPILDPASLFDLFGFYWVPTRHQQGFIHSGLTELKIWD